MRKNFHALLLLLSLPAAGAERIFNFSEFPTDKTPPGFNSFVAGGGETGEWRIVMDDVPPILAPQSDKAPSVTKRAVLAQLNQTRLMSAFPCWFTMTKHLTISC